MNQHDGKPPAAWLNQLHEAGHWARLIDMALRSLAVDPNDPVPHRHLAWACAKTGRLPQMRRHVDFLLKAEPDEPRNHHLAAIYFLETNQNRKARVHIDFLLRENPNSATYHYLACIHALRRNNVPEARRHIAQARAFAPHWAEAAHLEIKIDGIRQRKAKDAWGRIRRLKQTLSLDPRNADVMTTIGNILLNELEQPREAEGFFRDALFIDPTDKVCQSRLLDAIRARSLLYRTLSLPASALRHMRKIFREGKVRWLFVIVAIKALLASLAWLLVIGVFFAPAAKIYEWLVLADIPRRKALPRILAPLRAALRWPLWSRLGIASVMIFGTWLLVLWKLFGQEPLLALQLMAGVFGAHLALVGISVGFRRLRARFGRWQEARRLRREQSVVHPEMA